MRCVWVCVGVCLCVGVRIAVLQWQTVIIDAINLHQRHGRLIVINVDATPKPQPRASVESAVDVYCVCAIFFSIFFQDSLIFKME